MKRRWVLGLLVVLGGLMALRCAAGDGGFDDWGADGDLDADADADGTWECFSANDCPAGQYCNEFHRCVSPPPPDPLPDGGAPDGGTPWIPPEVEHEFGPPTSGSRYVYVPLPDQDSVARIDSETLDVVGMDVGDRPSLVATAEGRDLAVVLNEGSASISVLRTVAGEDRVVTLGIPLRLNRLVVGPDGEAAVAYFELESPDARDVGSFQDVAVVRMTAGEEAVYGVTVGFRPRQVVFSPDGAFAYVITEDGVSTLDLSGPAEGFVAPTIPVTADPIGEGIPAEVVVSPDGSRVFARWAGLAAVRAVDLETGEIVDTALGGVPTDIDVTEDGDRLVAVVRETSQVVVMELPDGIGAPEALRAIDCPSLTVGLSVLVDGGARALVFSNAINQKAVALVDLESGEVRLAMLRKGVRSLALSPDGANALILHNRIPGDPSPLDDFETQLDHRFGFSLLRLDTLFAKLQVTSADPGAFAFVADGSAAYLIVADEAEGLRDIAALDLDSYIVTTLSVGSHPTEIGAVSGTGRVYVSQRHPMGRMSFIDVETGAVRTVTGFQLNGQIEE